MLSDADIRFLKENVFAPVAERVKGRRDSLSGIARFLSSKIGFEGWFKVEALGALGSQVKRLYNQGADLELVNGIFIELKSSANCSSSRFLAGLTQHQDKPQYSRLACLFIGGGSERQISSCLKGLELASTMLVHEKFSAGTNEWIIGLIVPNGTAAISTIV